MFSSILFDADGVVIKRHKYFSEIYAESVGLDAKADFLPFFTGEFQQAVIGKADLLQLVSPWLKRWKWHGSPQEFLSHWFKTESDLQQDVLTFIQNLRKRDIKIYLASQQERRRGEYMLHELGLQDKFDGFFLTYELGIRKDNPQYYLAILKQIETDPESVLFIDDDQDNIKAAEETGIKTHFYRDLNSLRKIL